MLVKNISGTTLTSVEDGLGNSLTITPNKIVNVAEEMRLHEDFPTKFALVTNQDTILKDVITITSAEVLAIRTTPKALVAAPGAGYWVDVVSIVGSIDYNSAAYATNVTMEFRYTDVSGTKVTADIGALLDATADKTVRVQGIEAALVPTANAAVVATTAAGNPATGNSVVTVTVFYRILPL